MAGVPLVVGGAGFIGSALVRLLAERGPVRVLDDLSTGKRENLEGVPSVELRVGSILDPASVAAALSSVDVVFLTNAIWPRISPAAFFAVCRFT